MCCVHEKYKNECVMFLLNLMWSQIVSLFASPVHRLLRWPHCEWNESKRMLVQNSIEWNISIRCFILTEDSCPVALRLHSIYTVASVSWTDSTQSFFHFLHALRFSVWPFSVVSLHLAMTKMIHWMWTAACSLVSSASSLSAMMTPTQMLNSLAFSC